MFVVMGSTGHVGSAVASTLRANGQRVVEISHRTDTMSPDVAHADVNDVESLRSAFRRGKRAFLLNPPADIHLDTDTIERGTVANILWVANSQSIYDSAHCAQSCATR